MSYFMLAFVIALWAIPSVFISAQTFQISEISPANASIQDEDGDETDWIELYNPGPGSVNLKSYRIGDKPVASAAWALPDSIVLPGEYVVVRASGKNKAGSGLVAIEAAGAGINPWNTWDAFYYLYQPVDGDFDAALRIHSLQKVGTLTKCGLMLVDIPDAYNRHAGVFATTRDVFTSSVRSAVGQAPDRVTDFDLPIELPFTWVRLRRVGDSVYSYASMDGKGWEAVDSALCPFADTQGYIGIAVASYKDTTATRTTVSDFVVNGQQLAIPELLRADIGTSQPGSLWASREIHTDFELKSGGEQVYLWDTDGALVDSLAYGAVRADMTFGRTPADGRKVFFLEGTPGRNNTAEGKARIADKPLASVPAGHYSQEVKIELSSRHNKDRIFYTVDGSVPNTLSNEYTGTPIVLASTATLRARAYADDALPGAVATYSYFIAEQTQLPVVSLTIEPEHLWGDHGIFDNPLYDIEVPGTIEMWEPDGTQALSQDIGIKVHGRVTKTLPQKPLRLYARSQYGTGSFDYPLFASKPIQSYDRVLLRGSGQDWYSTFLRDALSTSLAMELRFDVQAYRPVAVFVNGQYWGIQNMRERLDEKFIEQNHGVPEGTVDLLEEKALPRAGSSLAYHTMVDSLAQMAMEDSAAYEYAASAIDIGSFTDYMATAIFLSIGDWPQYNQKYWRERTPTGRWRWVMYDTDMGLGFAMDTTAYNKDVLAIATSPVQNAVVNPPYSTFLLRTLLKNPKFRTDFINRSADILNTTLRAERIHYFVDSLSAGIAAEVPRHVERWKESLANWDEELYKLRYFVDHRHDAMRKHYRWKFGVGGTATVTLNVAQPGTGTIRFSTVLPKELPWTGVYFHDVPITATAIPAPGYRFLRWATPGVEQTPTTTVTLHDDMELVAVFVREGASGNNGVVINEIMYKPADKKDSKDWIELFNGSDDDVDLSGWMLRDDDDAHLFIFPAGTLLPANGYIVVCNSASAFANVYGAIESTVIGDIDFGFGTPSDKVLLFNAFGEMVDSVPYNINAPWPADASGTGKSIELLNPALDNAFGESWRSSQVEGGSPGAINDAGTSVGLVGATSSVARCFPNPVVAGTDVYVLFDISNTTRILPTMLDVHGRTWPAVVHATEHSSVARVSTTGLAPGQYFLRVELVSSVGRKVQIVPLLVR